jgi:hypothetical protein
MWLCLSIYWRLLTVARFTDLHEALHVQPGMIHGQAFEKLPLLLYATVYYGGFSDLCCPQCPWFGKSFPLGLGAFYLPVAKERQIASYGYQHWRS